MRLRTPLSILGILISCLVLVFVTSLNKAKAAPVTTSEKVVPGVTGSPEAMTAYAKLNEIRKKRKNMFKIRQEFSDKKMISDHTITFDVAHKKVYDVNKQHYSQSNKDKIIYTFNAYSKKNTWSLFNPTTKNACWKKKDNTEDKYSKKLLPELGDVLNIAAEQTSGKGFIGTNAVTISKASPSTLAAIAVKEVKLSSATITTTTEINIKYDPSSYKVREVKLVKTTKDSSSFQNPPIKSVVSKYTYKLPHNRKRISAICGKKGHDSPFDIRY